MANRKTVRVPEFSGVLAQRGKFWSSDPKDGIECVEALAQYYHVSLNVSILNRKPVTKFLDRSKPLEEQVADWRLLALRLAFDIVPAFRRTRKSGAPKRHTRSSQSFPYAHEARLVQLTRFLEQSLRAKGLPSHRTDAFRALIRLHLGKAYPSWRFGTLTKASSFAQAWKKIPKAVKADPDKYIPEVLEEVPTFQPGPVVHDGMFGMGDLLVRIERYQLTKILPPALPVVEPAPVSSTN